MRRILLEREPGTAGRGLTKSALLQKPIADWRLNGSERIEVPTAESVFGKLPLKPQLPIPSPEARSLLPQ